MPHTRTLLTRRRLLSALYLGCVAVVWLIVCPFLSREPTPAVTPATADSADDIPGPLFTPVQLPPGRWVLNVNDVQPSDPTHKRARESLGIAIATDFDLSTIPVPPGARLDAVRVDLDGRPCAVLTSQTDSGATQRVWKASGWAVTGHEFGPGLNVFRLTRNGTVATAWALPRGTLIQLLITAPVRATLDGGSDR